jgi:hypothetical protein
MEFAELLKKRRMVRRFSTDPISRDALGRIARAAKRAECRLQLGPASGHRHRPGLMARVAQGADEDDYADIGYYRWVSHWGAQSVPCVSEPL